MKTILLIVELAFTVVMTFCFCLYIGQLFNQVVIGIFTGFFLSLSYLAYSVYKNIKIDK